MKRTTVSRRRGMAIHRPPEGLCSPCGTRIATPPERIAAVAYIERITGQSGGAITHAQLEARAAILRSTESGNRFRVPI